MQDYVAALPQRCLSAEVCNDVHQPVTKALDRHAIGDALQQPQRIDIPSYVVHQLACMCRANGFTAAQQVWLWHVQD